MGRFFASGSALAIACLTTLAAQIPSTAVPENGSIRGRVTVPVAAAAGNRPAVSDLGAPTHGPIDRRRVVVYLKSAPREAFAELRPSRERMDQRGEQFVPHVLAITVGTTVDFPNNDTTFHNVFSLSRVRSFDLGRFAPGRTGAVRFDRPGIVPVFCDIHSHMNAYILVFTHPFFAVSDSDGRYEIANVPAGTYSLMVWSELGNASPRLVTVTDGNIVEADFNVAP